jgi:hypothetical protein
MRKSARPAPAAAPTTAQVLAAFPRGLPELLDRRSLLRRRDTKFALPDADLASLLEPLCTRYALITSPRSPWARYQSLYFDTPELHCYHAHRRGQQPRYKLRIRQYLDRELAFLEIKERAHPNQTLKHRLRVAFEQTELGPDERVFIGSWCPLPPHELEPQLWTRFERLTLVGLESGERVTIDTQVRFVRGKAEYTLDGVAIVEVKQWPYRARTPMLLALRARGLREIEGSKYCTGTALSVPHVPRNRFLPTLRALGREPVTT